MVYTVTCNPSLDYYLYLSHLSASGIHRATDTTLTYGGKGINVSAMLSRLGVATTALGFIAGWLAHGDYAAALRLGNACGSATAFSDTLATRAEIDRLSP